MPKYVFNPITQEIEIQRNFFSDNERLYFGGSIASPDITEYWDGSQLLMEMNGAMVSSGTFGSGPDMTISGDGTRMIWYPKKAAFRVGYAVGTQWRENEIGDYSTVAGGYGNNSFGDYASVGGGYNNKAEGEYSNVGGGLSNRSSGQLATVVGGFANLSSGIAAFVGGGAYNNSTNNNAVIMGGTRNNATGINSVVVGGTYNTASGETSFAFGNYLTVSGTSSIGFNMFNDEVPQTLSADNTFAIIGGYVGIGTLTPDTDYFLTITGSMTATSYDGLTIEELDNIADPTARISVIPTAPERYTQFGVPSAVPASYASITGQDDVFVAGNMQIGNAGSDVLYIKGVTNIENKLQFDEGVGGGWFYVNDDGVHMYTQDTLDGWQNNNYIMCHVDVVDTNLGFNTKSLDSSFIFVPKDATGSAHTNGDYGFLASSSSANNFVIGAGAAQGIHLAASADPATYDGTENGLIVDTDGSVETTSGRIKGKTRITSTDSPYTVADTDENILASTDSGAITILLKAGVEGRYLRIVNTGSSSNDVTLTPNGTEKLNGVNASETISDGEKYIQMYDSTEGWW